MPFIGVISKENDSNFIKNVILKNADNNKFEIININKENIKNIKNVKFETIVINDDITSFLQTSNYLENFIKQAKFLIINSDIFKNLHYFVYNKKNFITYGLNQKANITISSIKKENVLICVQNKIINSKGSIIEEQEVKVELKKNNQKKIYNTMVVYTILTLYGEKIKKI